MNYIYGMKQENPDESEWWIVHNYRRTVSCSSELACQKIIKLAKWMEDGFNKDTKPLNHITLEKKAVWLVFGRYSLKKRRR